ncbi:YrhA family protein [Bacillus sp. DX4.1]|uniref:YrhA family protein n=1 Tax=Bacillus sp. DX4.1 TaxID=3055867 RepID=UPI0025A2CA66|nr:YrhA family protein [Bacillus sp. DX4.1]MDM5187378.1 YrhA family protein [Bacillus sp. DX4.1]
MVLDLLSSIEKIKNKRGKSIIQSASDESIQNIKNWISSNVKKNVWVNEYENFLKIANGLDFNGLVIYNANPTDDNNGFITANEIWRENEWDSNYLFFGDSSIAWFCFDVDSHLFLELDKPSGDIMAEYHSFNEMIEQAIKNVL